MQIFTDGGCHGNPGPGGWAYIVRDGENTHQSSGAERATTNNRMELTAVIRALRFIAAGIDKPVAPIEVYTDSQYVQKGISEWIHGWMRNGWKTASKDPVKNKELWQELWDINSKVKPVWRWVKGHAGHPENEACDSLVQEAIRTIET